MANLKQIDSMANEKVRFRQITPYIADDVLNSEEGFQVVHFSMTETGTFFDDH